MFQLINPDKLNASDMENTDYPTNIETRQTSRRVDFRHTSLTTMPSHRNTGATHFTNSEPDLKIPDFQYRFKAQHSTTGCLHELELYQNAT